MTSLPTFKKVVTADKLHASAVAQSQDLPDSGLEMLPAQMCERIREYLWAHDLARIAGSKNLPLYPMEWQDSEEGLVCTGVPMKLMRVNNRMKKKDGAEFVNPNYGRFFFARHVQQVDDEGTPVFNDKGFAVMDMADFVWFVESQYAQSGALMEIGNPDLSILLQSTYGEGLDPANMWPTKMIKALC